MATGGWKSEGEKFGSFLKAIRLQYSRCLDPTFSCTEPAIRAHSIQNSRVLDLLQVNGHVIVPEFDFAPDCPPHVRFVRNGRNLATTFAGLCSKHDDEIFRPIEKGELDLHDPEHLFLLAYRAATRELHASMEAAVRLQHGYSELVDRGVEPADELTETSAAAANQVARAFGTFTYRARLDEAKEAGEARVVLKHEVQVLRVRRPTLAACSLFSLDGFAVEGSTPMIHLNVLPLETDRTAFVLSWVPEFYPVAQSYFRRLLYSDRRPQLAELSRLVITHCENFVISPACFDEWPSTKTEAIADHFMATMWPGVDPKTSAEDLYLF